jgi:hypothetical protein
MVEKSEEVASPPAALPAELEDAFSSGDEAEGQSVFDIGSIVGIVRKNSDGENADIQPRPDDESRGRNGRHLPPPLTIVTEPFPSVEDPNSDDGAGRRERFENVTLSPPISPAATSSLSPHQVPVPISPTPPLSPSVSSSLTLGSSLRSVSPRPHYLSPTSNIPVPHEVDPVPSPSPLQSDQTLTKHRSSSVVGVVQPRPYAPTMSSGPSTLEKVMSRTRPAYLPPKRREEDLKHLHDWNEMMKQSRAAEERRKAELDERRRSREMSVDETIVFWEREIVPDWRAAMRKPNLRRAWWNGIPTKLRGKMWLLAIGNGLALSKGDGHVSSFRCFFFHLTYRESPGGKIRSEIVWLVPSAPFRQNPSLRTCCR